MFTYTNMLFREIVYSDVGIIMKGSILIILFFYFMISIYLNLKNIIII